MTRGGFGVFKRGCRNLLLACFIVLWANLASLAHPIVFSEYSLKYENEQWVLSFDQKTSYLRDAIYAVKPDLKGMNLNSSLFLEATADHITSNLTLKYRGKLLRIIPQQMKYGGLKFQSTFLVEGLTVEPDYLTIKTDGFDVHEHSVVLFRIGVENEGYLNYFNKDQKLATFDFTAHRYVFEEITPSGHYEFVFYAILIAVLIIGLAIRRFRAKKVIKMAI